MELSELTDINVRKMLEKHHRALHQIPEVGDQLYETREYLMSVLSGMNCEFTTVVNTGICAYFHKGRKETTAYRSDMDGLVLTEDTGLPYSSRHEGRMHGCGHDAHMSMLLAFAEYVNAKDDMPYNVLLIFQPAEETIGGAQKIVESGIFEKYNVVRTFGIHMWPALPMGTLATKAGALMPKSSEVTVKVVGKSTHAATSYKGIDAIMITTQYIQDIYRMQEEETPKEERTLLKICKFEGGTARNVICGEVNLLGTMRAFSLETFDFMERRLKEIAKTYEDRYGCSIKVHCTEGYLPVINSQELFDTIKPTLEGLENFTELTSPVMISEDFSYYGTKSQAVFTFLGTGASVPLHSVNFVFDENTLLYGYKYYVALSGVL